MTRDYQLGPAHPFDAGWGTGIKWTPKHVELWTVEGCVGQAAHESATPWDFWYRLGYREAFPQVTHWWFRSVWTGRIAVSAPDPALTEPDAVWGTVQFDVLDRPRLPWSVAYRPLVRVQTPLPPLAVEGANLPLRLSLARAVLGVIQGDLLADDWVGVTSLVAAGELERVLPVTWAQAAQAFGGSWRLHGVDDPPRRALCRLLGLAPPDEA
jgi:hypothetical protein